jgi:hypothetical protein
MRLRVEGYIDYLLQVLDNPKIIWFYYGEKCPPIQSFHVTPIDLSRQGINIHDRFLLLYDGDNQHFVNQIHLGGSINSFDINGTGSMSVMRISQLLPGELQEIDPIIQQLETIYYRESGESTNWGC